VQIYYCFLQENAGKQLEIDLLKHILDPFTRQWRKFRVYVTPLNNRQWERWWHIAGWSIQLLWVFTRLRHCWSKEDIPS